MKTNMGLSFWILIRFLEFIIDKKYFLSSVFGKYWESNTNKSISA